MAVYVDRMRHRLGRMIMCHMVADSRSELFAMADSVGVARKWFQNHPRAPHFDVCLSKRTKAVAAGAIDATRREFVACMRKVRKNRSMWDEL